MSRNQQETPIRIPGRGITLRETDLFEAYCCALESGEFRQITGAVRDEGNGRCAYGVLYSIAFRAGHGGDQVEALWATHRRFRTIERRAGALLGFRALAEANDAGCSFNLLAPALRAARIEVERG